MGYRRRLEWSAVGALLTRAAPQVERVAWPDFLAQLDWRLGEHVSLIGSTGKGKTTLALALLPFRRAAAIWSSKPTDDTIDKHVTASKWRRPTAARPYRSIGNWPPPPGEHRVMLRPATSHFDTARAHKRNVFHECVAAIMSPGGGNWCIFADDTYYLCEHLGMTDDLTDVWAMGRSHGVSLMAATQRPANIPLLAYQATHLFLWRENDARNLKRLSEISAADTKVVEATVQALGPHEALYVNSNTGQMARTQVR